MPKNSQFTPPALPPKKQRVDSSNVSLNSINSPPMSPKISNDNVFSQKQNESNEPKEAESHGESEKLSEFDKNDNIEPETVVLRKKPTENKTSNLMEEINVHDYLVFKKDGDDGSRTLIGGRPEALIINATKVQKISEGKILQDFFL